VADRDFLIEYVSHLAIIAMHTSRIAEQWVLWTSEEFKFMIAGDSVSTGSSIMPQKKNPDPMELTRGKTARVYGSLVNLLTLCKGLPMVRGWLHNATSPLCWPASLLSSPKVREVQAHQLG
jgi:argininosuccinate lyase